MRRYKSGLLAWLIVCLAFSCWRGGAVHADAIHDAVRARNTAEVTRLLDENPKLVNEPDEQSNYTAPLVVAIGNDDVAMVKLLISRGADVNLVPTLENSPPIVDAAQSSKPEATAIVKLLLAAGAKVYTTPVNASQDPFREATIYNNVPLLKLLATKSPAAQRPSDYLSLAAGSLCVDATLYWIARGADVNVRSKTYGVPIVNAVVAGCGSPTVHDRAVRIIRLLLAHGASLKTSDRQGVTPIAYAEKQSATSKTAQDVYSLLTHRRAPILLSIPLPALAPGDRFYLTAGDAPATLILRRDGTFIGRLPNYMIGSKIIYMSLTGFYEVTGARVVLRPNNQNVMMGVIAGPAIKFPIEDTYAVYKLRR